MLHAPARPKMVRFPHADAQSFSRELRRRVHAYFEEKGISKKGDPRMFVKTGVMMALYAVPYGLMLGLETSLMATLGLFVVMGLGMSGIGMSVMHDAVHGAYHRKPWVNELLGATIYLISGNVTTWRFQHNVLHHTFTNIEGLDEDLEVRGLVRLHPKQRWRKIHRAQAWYAPVVYGLLTLNWVVMKDFSQMLRYQKRGLTRFSTKKLRQEWATLILTKGLYGFLLLGLPMMASPAPWYGVVLGFLVMHLTAGFLLSFVFQLAHVVDHAHTFQAPSSGKMDDAWMEHQLLTTSNFAPRSKLLGWFVGGLNFQIEHHLFPNICHVHYPGISDIVRRTAEEFGLPYHQHPRLREAIGAHLYCLRSYSRRPEIAE